MAENKKLPKLKFSHRYKKFGWIITPAKPINVKLLQIFKTHYNDLSESFKLYDTTYKEGYGINVYKLPQTELIVLILGYEYSFHMFTTIRRYTPEKYEYYKRMIGRLFELVVDSGEK